jgi:hypothetical protein
LGKSKGVLYDYSTNKEVEYDPSECRSSIYYLMLEEKLAVGRLIRIKDIS